MVHPRTLVSSGGSRGQTRAGFTLVELMATVAIVGVLAVVAYAGYRKFVVSAHQTEANAMLSGIKNRQEAYKAETGAYLNVSTSLAANQATSFPSLYPHCLGNVTLPSAQSVGWGQLACPATCCNTNADWQKLKVESNAPTFYGYSTVAGCTAASATATCPVASPSTLTIKFSGNSPTWPTSILGPWFIATAVGDADGNKVFSTVMISSFDNAVYVDNDGE